MYFLGASLGDQVHVLVLKLFPILSIWLFSIYAIRFLVNRKDTLVLFLFATLLLNPAILIHTAILGYQDGFYISILAISIVLIGQIDNLKNKAKLQMLVVAFLLVFGTLAKWQFIIFLPSLTCVLYKLAVKCNLQKQFRRGIIFGILFGFLTLLVGSNSVYDIIQHSYGSVLSLHRITHDGFVTANFPNFWFIMGFLQRLPKLLNTGDGSIFYSSSFPWFDRKIQSDGRYVFLIIAVIMTSIIIYKVKRLKKINFANLATVLSLWSIIMYSEFNTGVHENHLISAVPLSLLLFTYNKTFRSAIFLLWFSVFNFLNLNHFYGLGSKGIFGYNFRIMIFGYNTAFILALVNLFVFIFLVRRLISSHDDSLGF